MKYILFLLLSITAINAGSYEDFKNKNKVVVKSVSDVRAIYISNIDRKVEEGGVPLVHLSKVSSIKRCLNRMSTVEKLDYCMPKYFK